MRAAPIRCWVRVNGQEIELRAGVTVLGRHDSCHVVLDDPLVSRRHATVSFDGVRVTLEDLGSINGVLLNGQRLQGSEVLRHGDELELGSHLIQIRFGEAASERASDRWGARTLDGSKAPHVFASEENTAIRDGEALETLAVVAGKILDRGRPLDAERVLKGPLDELLQRVIARERIEGTTLALAASVAVRLAEGTRKGAWINYVFSLYAASRSLLPAPIIERLYDVVRVANHIDVEIIRGYLTELRVRQATFGPSDRFLLRRLDGLEQLVALG